MDKQTIHETNSAYWNTKGNDHLGAVVLPFYGSFISEENHGLFGDVAGKRLLEIGCGNGQSLRYHGERSAVELWGMDISENQLEKAKQHLTENGLSATLICSPMEEECGIPADYFDFVYSVFAIGWTTDLEGTFERIASYLKTGGSFIFSWSHPFHKCIAPEDGAFRVYKSYFEDAWYSVPYDFCQGELKLTDRMVSTYVNALAKAGFAIERMIEEPDRELFRPGDHESELVEKMRMVPRTMVIKARKLS